MRLIILSSVLTYFVQSCSSSAWTSEEKDEFISGCKNEGGNSGYCDCFMEMVMAKFPNYVDSKKMDFETAVELSKSCE